RPGPGHEAHARLQRRVDVDMGVDARGLSLRADGIARERVGARARVAGGDRAEEREVGGPPGDRGGAARRAAGADARAVAVVDNLLDEQRVRRERDLTAGEV